jgi:hypothetical protein
MSGTVGCALRTVAPQPIPSYSENEPTKANTLLIRLEVSSSFWLQLVPESAKSMLTLWPQSPPLELMKEENATAPSFAPANRPLTGPVRSATSPSAIELLVSPTSVPPVGHAAPLLPLAAPGLVPPPLVTMPGEDLVPGVPPFPLVPPLTVELLEPVGVGALLVPVDGVPVPPPPP